MNLENNPDEVWQCNVCDKSFQSYSELKNHWHSIHIMDPKNKRLTKQDIKDMESQVTKTLIKKEEKKIGLNLNMKKKFLAKKKNKKIMILMTG